MAASHFTKLVFDKADKIKIHICVDHGVANGAERGQAFVEAIKHVGEFMNDASKFKLCFSMTATKVPRTLVYDDETGDEKPKSDDAEIQGIGDTIKTDSIPLLTKQIKKETDEKAKQVLKNALSVFEALSTMENGKYTRIGLFRTPATEGPLSKSKPMINSKMTIITAMEKKTDFVVVSKGDFNYAIDASTKVQMLTVAKNLNENLIKGMDQVGVDLAKACTERMHSSNNWRKTQSFLADVQPILDDYSKKLRTLSKLEKNFIFDLYKTLMAANVPLSKATVRHLEKQLGCLAFLENMFDEISTTIPKSSLDEAYKFVTQAIFWYKTLYKVYDVLSEDMYQENRDKYNVADLNDWGNATKNTGLRLSDATADRFFKLLNIDVAPLRDFALTEIRMNELNSVVQLTLIEKTNIEVTPDGVLLATGPFIPLSRVLEAYKHKENQIKKVNIFASCVVHVDTDFAAPGRHMTIAAAKWKVKDKFTISLDGESGEDRRGTAEAGRGATPGEDGLAGGSGKCSGHFIGIADSIDNAQFLTISATGGRGGKGQTGGTGGNGAKGVDAIMPTDKNNSEPPSSMDYDFVKGWIHETDDNWSYHKYSIFWRILGKRAQRGLRGGHGGAGGLGGPKGELLLSIFKPSQHYPNLRNRDGDEGDNARGGAGGNGAKNGNDLLARYYEKNVMGFTSQDWEQNEVYDMGTSDSGPSGQTGGNKGGRVKETQVPVNIMAFSLNYFKGETIRFAANSPLLREDLKQMLVAVDKTEKFNILYTVPAYLNEMTTIENIYYSIFKSINTTPFYKSLLERIKTYAELHKSDRDKTKRLALSTIYAACLSKLCSLELATRSQGVIIDVEGFVDLTLKRIDNLAAIDKRVAVKEFQKSYHENIDVKVREADQLMDKKVNPAIERILRSMDDKLDELVKEVIQKIEKAKDKKAELIEEKKQMEKALLIKSCLNVIKMGAMLASFAGPIGAAVGGVVTAGVTIGESFVVEPDAKQGDAILVPPGVSDALKNLGDFVAETRAKKYKKFETQLKSIEDELKDPPVDLQEVNKKVSSIRERLEKEKAKVVPDGDEDAATAKDKNMKDLQDEMKSVLSEKKTGLKEQIDKGDKAKKSILDKVDKLQKGLKVIETGMDVYNKYKGDKKKLDAISDSIAQADKAIESLQKYESQVESAMFPMVRKMREDVNKVKASLSTKSQVALDVQQWEVQGTLRGVRNILERATEGYATQADITGCFDALSEAMNLLVHIYDRLENYRDQQKLGDLIANIGAPGQYDELLRGTEYDEDVTALNMTIQSNLVLLEYDNAMKAFLQWVFPFARRYMEQTSLPDNLKPVRNQQTLKDLVVAAKKQLDSIKNDIGKYWTTIPNYTKFFFEGEFYVNDKLGGPFYVWSGKDHSDAIEGLFKGNEITLLADIRDNVRFVNSNSDTRSAKRMAIKFSSIYIRFNLAKKFSEEEDDEKNEERQRKFDDIMENFVVNLVHTGTNYYDFRENYYVIYGDPLTLSYSVRKNADGKHDIKSTSRDKVMKGDLLLSPYTLWTVRLSADRRKAFDDIREFVDDISLELTGMGKYIFDDDDQLAAYNLRAYDYYQIDGKKRDTNESFE
ncbi:hypothetical protein Bhyg_05142 [Pseudolycoriella hygida]|uniref:Uncharacterized protein n=1 Tax=Pseudolycoriella hygida TaxID=35572 RepID=A0A9Q0NGJ4_9DIPT|nr:hypothetical protein Bhyg_05142 [Pseudolycoriella hygida]